MRIAPSADGGETCGSAAGPAPHFLFLRRRENGPLGGPKEKNWSRRDRCGADLHARAGCARHGQNHDRIPPQADTSGLLSGWQTHGICFSFRCCSPYLTVVRSEAERAGPEVCQIRQPPRKDVGSFRLRGCSARVSSMSGAPGRRLASHGSSDSPDSRSGPNLTPKRVKFAAPAPFSSTGRGAFFFGKTKKNGGRISQVR